MERLELYLGDLTRRRIFAVIMAAYGALTLALPAMLIAGMTSGALAAGAAGLVGLGVFAGLASWFWRAFAPHKLSIGEDGVAVDRAFLPIDEVLWFAVHEPQGRPRGLLIGRRGDEPLILTFRAPPERYGELVRLLTDKLSEARAKRAQELRPLERAGRSLAAWRAGVERAALTAGDFRNVGLTSDQIEGVLADPAAPADQRLGAALALRAQGSSLERVRIAAVATAAPRLRVALERIAEAGDPSDEQAQAELDAALEQALSEEPVPRP